MTRRLTRAIKWFNAIWPPLAVLIVGIAMMQLGVQLSGVKKYLMPAPSDIWGVVQNPQSRQTLLSATWVTAQESLIGLGLSIIVGTVTALILSSSRLVQRAFYPYTVFFQTVPVVAIAPLLVIWLGAGLNSVAACAFIVSVFPIIANTLSGMLSVDPSLRDLFRLYHARRMATLFKLRLPAALPNIITGLRIASGLAVIGAVVGEFVAGTLSDSAGLGVRVLEAKKWGRTEVVFADVLAASLLGLALFGAVNLFSWIMMRHWRENT